MPKKIGLGILLALMASAASAGTSSRSSCTAPQSFVDYVLSLFTGVAHCPGTGGNGGGGVTTVKAPEIDPSSAMAGLTLMGAGLLVLRGRRTSK